MSSLLVFLISVASLGRGCNRPGTLNKLDKLPSHVDMNWMAPGPVAFGGVAIPASTPFQGLMAAGLESARSAPSQTPPWGAQAPEAARSRSAGVLASPQTAADSQDRIATPPSGLFC